MSLTREQCSECCPILLSVSKDNNSSSSTRIMNSLGQMVIAFVCALVLVLTPKA